MNAKLLTLALGNFAIGGGALIMPGMMNVLVADLHSSPAAIGQILAAFAITICFAGPVLAAFSSHIERRTLLAGTLALYAVGHLLSAIAPNYWWLMAARVVCGLGAALFTAQAAATVSVLVPAEKRASAVANIFLGWSLAAVLGMPMGAYLAAHLGWRSTLLMMAILIALIAGLVWQQIPARLFIPALDRSAWKKLFNNKLILCVLMVTALQASGQFVVYSYLATVFTEFIPATPTQLSLLFLWLGALGFAGNIVGSMLMRTRPAAHVGLLAIGACFVGMLLWPLAYGSWLGVLMGMALWGLGGFAANSSQQGRLLGMAPELASATVAINSSSIYLGQAVGASLGGVFLSAYGTHYLSWLAAGFIACAFGLSYWVLRQAKK